MSVPFGSERTALSRAWEESSRHRPRIYAELLPNIRRVSLAVELPSLSDENTRITIAHEAVRDGDADRKVSLVSVVHQGLSTSLALPAAVQVPEHDGRAHPGLVAQSSERVLFPSPQKRIGKTSYIWRLALAPGSADALGSGLGDFVGVPLSAVDCQPGAALHCWKCGQKAAIVPSGRVKAWKDLPDEGWAEMMDFWHCHKPQVATKEAAQRTHGLRNGKAVETSEDDLASRGYGANSKIAPSPGLALIDISTIWCSTEDCTGVGVSEISRRLRFRKMHHASPTGHIRS
jgi:ubiquitin-protein ligase E3 D